VCVEHLVVGRSNQCPRLLRTDAREVHLAQVVRDDKALIGGCLRLNSSRAPISDELRLRRSLARTPAGSRRACQLPLAPMDCGPATDYGFMDELYFVVARHHADVEAPSSPPACLLAANTTWRAGLHAIASTVVVVTPAPGPPPGRRLGRRQFEHRRDRVGRCREHMVRAELGGHRQRRPRGAQHDDRPASASFAATNAAKSVLAGPITTAVSPTRRARSWVTHRTPLPTARTSGMSVLTSKVSRASLTRSLRERSGWRPWHPAT